MLLVLFPLIHFICVLIYAVLGVFILFQGYRSRLNRMVAVFLMFFGIWSLSNMMIQNPGTMREAVKIWNDIGAIGWIGFGSFFLGYVLVFIKKEAYLKKWWYWLAVYGPIPFFWYLQFRGLLITNYIKAPYGWSYSWSDTAWPHLFYFYYIGLVLLSIGLMVWYCRGLASESKKKQAALMIYTATASFILGSITNVLSQEFKIIYIPPLANVAATIWAFGVVYAIVKYRFLGISTTSAAHNIISTMSDALFLLDQGGHITTVNPAAVKMLGYEESELKGRSLDFISGEMKFKDKVLGSSFAGTEYNNYYTSLTTKAKKKIPVMFSTSILKDKNDKVKGVVSVARDITELKRVEKELQERARDLEDNVKEVENSERSLMRAFAETNDLKRRLEEERDKVSAIIANFVDPIIVVDKDSQLSLVNPQAGQVLRISQSDLGKKVEAENDYSLENFRPFINVDFKLKKIELDDREEMEEISIQDGNQVRTYKVLTAQIKDDKGQYLGTMKVFNNLTREKMIDQMKSEFIKIAAHQLRTPLSAVKWAIKMVLDEDAGGLNQEQKNILSKGYISNERVITLINDMLNVSRIEEGNFGYKFESCNIMVVVDLLLENLKPLLKQKDIDLSTNISHQVIVADIDQEKIYMALESLLTNAIKYSPPKSSVALELQKGEKLLTIRVKDKGMGIPAADQGKLFTKFFRAPNAVKVETDGSGLGLFIVKNIIEKHGGDVSFKSEEGKGTEFVCTIPLDKDSTS